GEQVNDRENLNAKDPDAALPRAPAASRRALNPAARAIAARRKEAGARRRCPGAARRAPRPGFLVRRVGGVAGGRVLGPGVAGRGTAPPQTSMEGCQRRT